MKYLISAALLSVLLTACSSHPAHHEHSQHQTTNHHNHQPQADTYKVTYTLKEGNVSSQQNATLQIRIQDTTTSKPIQTFTVTHEKLLHVIAVSEDLSYFSHLHPEYKGDGLFEVTTQFPAGGKYNLYADFIPTDGHPTTVSNWVTIAGSPTPVVSLQPDKNWTKFIDEKEITLTIDQLQAVKEATVTFTIKDATTKQPINHLQPYLGAIGHAVIITKDNYQYIHIHPTDEKTTGPDATFKTTFPKSGIYKIWGQF
jgi:hypothetical protein